MATPKTALDPSNSMYQPYVIKPPTPQYSIGDGGFTTDPNVAATYQKTGSINPGAGNGQITVPGVGQMSPQDAQKYTTQPSQINPIQKGVGLTPFQQQQQNTNPPPGTSITDAQNANPQVLNQNQSQTSLTSDQIAEKYQQGFNQLNSNGGKVPETTGEGRTAVAQAASSYQPAQEPYQPSPAFMQQGDPIMKTFVQAAMAYQQDVVDTGYTAKALQSQFANQVKNIDLQAMNIQNIMNGTRDDIRAEISKGGGFATESQVEGLVTTRNRDLLKQYNNIELQKQTMQNQMNLQVGMAQADHQYAQDKYNNVLKTTDLYKGIYTNATDQIDKLVQNVGYSGLAAAYGNDPYLLSAAEQHLNMPPGTLTDPNRLSALDTYRQQSLGLAQQRMGMSQQRLNITIANNTPDPDAVSSAVESYKQTGVIPSFKNQANYNAFWDVVHSQGAAGTIGGAQANKATLAANQGALDTLIKQQTASATALDTLDKQLGLVADYNNKVDRTGSPLVNKYLMFAKGQIGGDADTAAFQNIVKTASNEFAKILGGSAASIAGTPVSTAADAEKLLNASQTPAQLNSVMNLMKKEASFRMQSYNDNISKVKSSISNQQTQSQFKMMQGPDGKKYNVPLANVDKFIKAGGQEITQ